MKEPFKITYTFSHCQSKEARVGQSQDEQQDCQSDQGYEPSGEAFSIKHEDETDIYQGRSGLILHDDYTHRYQDDGGSNHEVLHAVYLVALLAQDGSKHQ